MSRSEYETYMASRDWFARRKAALAMQKVCQRCGAHDHLEVHHRSYENLGRETLDDLEVLCDECHDREHEKPRADRDRGRSNPRTVGDILRDLAAAPDGLDLTPPERTVDYDA